MPRKDLKNLTKIADMGDELQILKSLRHKLAVTIEESQSGRDVAALSRQLRDVISKISELESGNKEKKAVTTLDLILLKSELRKNAAQKRNSDDFIGEENDNELEEEIDSLLADMRAKKTTRLE